MVYKKYELPAVLKDMFLEEQLKLKRLVKNILARRFLEKKMECTVNIIQLNQTKKDPNDQKIDIDIIMAKWKFLKKAVQMVL